jgi:aspartate carbamoyltransferase catalytic subunit
MPSEVTAELAAAGIPVVESETLTPAIAAAADVLYVTRVQKERFADLET